MLHVQSARATASVRLNPGKLADIVLWNADELPMLCYRMGSNQVKKVIKRGRVAVK